MANQDHILTESYLIRLWRDRQHGPWRASLQKIRSGEVRHFACPEELWACLRAEMADKNFQKAGLEKVSGK